MGIMVSEQKAVSLNDSHEDGVDTSVEANPTHSFIKGLHVHHIFSRNGKGKRRDDGNPLIHALKGQKSFTITQHWKSQLFNRAVEILAKMPHELRDFDQCIAVPSSSPFCRECAQLISGALGVPLLEGQTLHKKLIGEVLADIASNPPKVRPGLKNDYTTQLNTWQQADPAAICQAKLVETSIRPLFDFLKPAKDLPELVGKRLILIDDIMSSGSSMLSGRAILANQLGAEVQGVTFLGRV